MKVRLLGNVKYKKQVHKAGSVLSMDENEFKGLNQLGLVEVVAEVVVEVKKEPKNNSKKKCDQEHDS